MVRREEQTLPHDVGHRAIRRLARIPAAPLYSMAALAEKSIPMALRGSRVGVVEAAQDGNSAHAACAGRLLHPGLDSGTHAFRVLENYAGWSKRPAQPSFFFH